jgi:hypothetical protein
VGKSSVYVLISSSIIVFIILLYSFCFCPPIKNTFAQSNLQDLVYQSPSFGIKINYPADWKANSDEADPKAEKSTIVTFIPKLNVNDTDGAVKVWVNNNPPTYNLMSFLQNEINNDRKNDASYTFGSSTIDTATLSGSSAFTHSYTTKINGQVITNYEIGSIINDKAYEITYYAKSDEFSINLPLAYRIINSFVVLPSSGNVNGSSTATGMANSTAIPSSNNNPIPSSPSNNNFNPIIQLNQFGNNQSGPNSKGSIQSGNKIQEPSNNQSRTSNAAVILPNNNSPNLNQPPIANAGVFQEVNSGFIVLLNGSQSYDPDGDPITYFWRQIAGPVVKLDDPTSVLPSFSTPSSIISDTKLVFELTVKDNKGAIGTSIVTVTVKPNVVDTISIPSTSNMTKSQPIPNTSAPVTSNGSGIVDQPLAGYLTYANPNYGISLNYKSDWIKSEGKGISQTDSCDGCNDIVTFTPPGFENEDYIPVYFVVSSFEYPNQVSISQVLDDTTSNDKSGLKHFTVTASDTSSTLAGKPAYTLGYTSDFKLHKKTIKSTTLETGTLHGNTVYFIDYTADSDKYPIYLPVVQNMIKSFKILNP